MAFLSLTSEQVNADSPLDETLMDTVRTNFDDLNTRTTALESAVNADASTGIFVGAKSPNNFTLPTGTTSYQQAKEIKLIRGGNFKISYNVISVSTAAITYNSRIFRNGTAVGTESTSGPAGIFTVTITQDIAGWTKNDLAQIQLKASSSSITGAVGSFIISSSEAFYLGSENSSYGASST